MTGYLRSRRRRSLSAREQKERINGSHMHVASMIADPVKRAEYEKTFVTPLKPKRQMRGVDIDAVHRKQDTRPLEKNVLKAVLDVLQRDPRVALVDRRQSGVFQAEDRYVRVGSKGQLDISGMLVGGRYFEIETKRPGEQPSERQAERIATIKANGGIAGYAWSAESALAILP